MTDNFENQNERENENDEFIEPEIGVSEETKKTGVAGNIAEAWRTRPLFKFMVLIGAVFAVGVGAMNFFGGNNASNELAHLANAPSTLKEAPGGKVSPYVREQTEMANKQRSEQAISSGGSALPTPIGQSSDMNGLEGDRNDPLNELRIETERLKKQVQQQQAQQAQQQVQMQQRPEQFDNTLAEAMQHQMQQLLESWVPRGMKNVTVARPDDLAKEAKAAHETAVSAASAASATSATAARKMVVSAGTVSYAQLLTEANSDVPGPIMAQIVSGPLAGARAIGSFQVADGYEKYLVLKFSIADKKGKDYQINAYALDPDTTLGGMATEVDERYFTRVILPAAAGFLQGLGQAMGQGGTSITTNGSTSISQQASNGYRQGIYNGLGTAAQTMGQFFQQQANLTKPLVRVASGTPIGMFFIAPVYDQSGDLSAQQPNAANMGGSAMNASYPGTNVSGYGSLPMQSSLPYPNYATQGMGNRGMAGYGNVPGYGGGYPQGYYGQ